MSKKKLCILTIAFSSLTLLMSFPAYSQPSNKSVLSMLKAGCAAHNTESEAYHCYDRGIKSALAANSIPTIMRNMCNVTRGKAKQEVYCYRRAVKETKYKALEDTIINACGRNTNWGSELACIVGAVESAMRR